MNETDVIQAELEAMKIIVDTLRPLTPESIKKVLRFVNDSFPSKGTSQATFEKSSLDEGQENQMYSEFHELYDAARPATGPEKALVAAFWLQEVQGNTNLDSFLINKELKSIEEPSSNITRDLDALVKRVPRWVHHTRKEGTPRKIYTLTTEGKRAVQRMLANNRPSTSVESDSNS
jgi:hypothetical protein